MNKTTQYLLFTLLLIIPFSGFATTYSHTITGSTWSAFGAQTLSGISWTATGNKGVYFGYDATKGQQFGSSTNPETTLSLSTSGFSQTITSIKINTSGASSIAGAVTVKVGNTSFSTTSGTSQALSSTATTYTFTGSATGTINIAWTQTSSKAIYLKSIEVTYSDLPPVVTAINQTGYYGTAFNYTISATNSPTSFSIASGSLPSGLTLSSTTGVIAGTPTATGTFNATVTATNASGTSDPAAIAITINKGNQTITFVQPDDATDLDQPFLLNASASSGLAVSFTSSNTAVATISGSTVTISGIGSTDITASQTGNQNFEAATPVTKTLTVKKWVAPTLSINDVSQNTFTSTPGTGDEQTFYISGNYLTDNINITLTGANANQFTLSQNAVTANSGTANNTLLTVSYAPTGTGTHIATLKLASTGAADVTHTLVGNASITGFETDQFKTTTPFVKDNVIYIHAINDETIAIYSSTGQLMQQLKAKSGLNAIPYNAKGVAIIKTGNTSYKVIL